MLYNQLKNYESNDLVKLYNEYTKTNYLDSVIRFLKEIRNSCNIPLIVGGNAIKSASKSQIQLLKKYDKVYFNFEKLDNLITYIKILIDN